MIISSSITDQGATMHVKDAFMRTIHNIGYDQVIFRPDENVIEIRNNREKIVKKIDKFDYVNETNKLIYGKPIGIVTFNIDGELYSWLSEVDGTADEFKRFIREYKLNY